MAVWTNDEWCEFGGSRIRARITLDGVNAHDSADRALMKKNDPISGVELRRCSISNRWKSEDTKMHSTFTSLRISRRSIGNPFQSPL